MRSIITKEMENYQFITSQVSDLMITAVGGHYTDSASGTKVAPDPWSLVLGFNSRVRWVEEGGRDGRSGAMTTSVPISWIEKLCQVRGLA
jgi:hypothetical protein